MERVSLEVANLELEELTQEYSDRLEFLQPLRVIFFNNERVHFKLLVKLKDVGTSIDEKLRFSFDATREMLDHNKNYIRHVFQSIINKGNIESVDQAISNPLLDGIDPGILPQSAYDVLIYLKEVNNKNISNMLVTFSVAVEKYISDIKDPNKKEKSFEIELTPEMSNNIKFREILEHLGYILSDNVDKEDSYTIVLLPIAN